MTRIYSVTDAAIYLTTTHSKFKYRVWVTKEFTPDGYIGKNPYFTEQTLDNIRAGVKQPNVAPPVLPLGSMEAARLMGISYASFFNLSIPADGEIGHTKYYWPVTIGNYGKRRHYPLYTMQEAAAWLGLPWATLKHHLYGTGWLKPDNPEARVNLFSEKTLSEFAVLYNGKRTLHKAKAGEQST